MKKVFILILISILLASCTPAPTSPSETEIARMVQQEVSKMLTAMPPPALMATNSPIPPLPLIPTAPLVAPVPTDDQTQAEKSNGTWLVGSEIAVGKWVSRGYANCIGFLLDKDGNSIDVQMGAEAILFVTSKGYSVSFNNPVCKWTYLPE